VIALTSGGASKPKELSVGTDTSSSVYRCIYFQGLRSGALILQAIRWTNSRLYVQVPPVLLSELTDCSLIEHPTDAKSKIGRS
jgi:hypothetical protein